MKIKNKISTQPLRFLTEKISEGGTPDMKYYAFDWDDNLMYMPTKIILINSDNEEVGMSTHDFAKYRSKIGEEEFKYEGHVIVGFAKDPFREFGIEGDDKFLIDSLMAETGPSWNDFVECINNGSIFAIITARGHNPNTLKESCFNLIISSKGGIDFNECLKNLRKYRDLADFEDLTDMEVITEYLDLCKFYPVTYGQGSAASPEELKVTALNEFIRYVKDLSEELGKKAFLKKKVKNYFLPSVEIGFSDDDPKNIETIKKHFGDEESLNIYSTKTGKKVKVKKDN